TIYHHDFADHMAATTTLEDVSSAERIYRWIAGVRMVQAKPITGFGPSQFFSNYQEYSVNKFITYISRNEEKSTIHNYYLQLAVEQGFPGVIIWFVLIIMVLILGQKLYHCTTGEARTLAMAVTLSYITILVNIALSDLIEADKIGTLFFMLMALLVVLDLHHNKTKALQ
ncbi:MAG: O-antigen ligase family protein, partial [Chitinophagales bacterium]